MAATELMQAHVGRLVSAFPELQDALDEHVRYNGEVLAHVFYGDVTRWFLNGLDTNRDRARDLARWLDTEFEATDEPVDNLIAVSFLENLPWPPDPDAERAAVTLGPKLRQELRAMQDWRPDTP